MTGSRLFIKLSVWLLCLSIPAIASAQNKFVAADADADGNLTLSEFTSYGKSKLRGFDDFKGLFEKLDTNGDSKISAAEFDQRQRVLRAMIQSGATRTPGNRGGAARTSDGLKIGEVAPTFKLKSLDGKSETDLATFKGKKPVVLIFGSYT